MKYRLEGTTFEAIDTFVRISLGNGVVRVTKNQCPKSSDVAAMLEQMQGYSPNLAQLTACSRAASDASVNKTILDL